MSLVHYPEDGATLEPVEDWMRENGIPLRLEYDGLPAINGPVCDAGEAFSNAIWARQLELWPDSIRLTPNQDGTGIWLLDADEAVELMEDNPGGVFYRCGDGHKYLGLRYGFEAHEYVSLFRG